MPSDSIQAPRGYLSEEHKQRFTIIVGIVAALFFILQFIFPFVLAAGIMPGLMSSHFGHGFTLSRIFELMMFAFLGPALILPMTLAFILSALMRRHRVSEYEGGSGKMFFGSLIRRALSQMIDLPILGAPAIAGILFLYPVFDPGRMIKSGRMLTGLSVISGGLLWGVAWFFLFAFLEGRWGATPGKWVVGIRVLGTDLQPCGFGRALLRNLLKLIDGFFNFMVGILVVALSESCQRLGDMAANTIVVDVRKGMNAGFRPKMG